MALIRALLLAAASAGASPQGTLKARVVSWDLAFKPPTLQGWIDRAAGETREALEGGARVVVFPELLAWGLAPYQPAGTGPVAEFVTRTWLGEVLPAVGKVLAGRDALVVLGTYPHQEAGWSHVLNRASVWQDGAWRFTDKLDPTPGELVEDPPVRPGKALPVYSFAGGRAAVLVCYSVEMPEAAAALKAAGVQLLLVPSATEDEDGVRRVLRTSSARAVELGAAVVVAPLLGRQDDWVNLGSAALFLPAQKGIVGQERVAARRSSGFGRADFDIPWAELLALRARSEGKPETRPFLSPSAAARLEPQAQEGAADAGARDRGEHAKPPAQALRP